MKRTARLSPVRIEPQERTHGARLLVGQRRFIDLARGRSASYFVGLPE
jgi:hypothetical protein